MTKLFKKMSVSDRRLKVHEFAMEHNLEEMKLSYAEENGEHMVYDYFYIGPDEFQMSPEGSIPTNYVVELYNV